MPLNVQVGDSFDGDITIINVTLDGNQEKSAWPWRAMLYTAGGTVVITAVALTLSYCVITGDYTFLRLVGVATTEVAVTAVKAKAK